MRKLIRFAFLAVMLTIASLILAMVWVIESV